MGFLVESLRDRGVEAYGLDISEYALGLVRKDIQAYCWKGSASDNLCRRYDLIVCIEVLEHMTPEQAEQAVVNFCRWTDDVVFSSTPDDFGEASHINVRPIEYWSDLFARFGFVRDLSFDASFIAPHARRFRKADGPLFKQLGRYEQVLARVERAEFSVRQRLMGTQTQLQQTESRLEEALAQIVDGQKRLDLTQNQLEMADRNSAV
jgi:hypothetical protein